MENHIQHCLFRQICNKEEHHSLAFLSPSTRQHSITHTYIYCIHTYIIHAFIYLYTLSINDTAVYMHGYTYTCVCDQAVVLTYSVYTKRPEKHRVRNYITVNRLQYASRFVYGDNELEENEYQFVFLLRF